MSISFSKPIIYVTRDIERALGIPLDTPGYFIITNDTPFAKEAAEGRDNVLLVDTATLLDTTDLLQHEDARDFIDARHDSGIIVFKSTGKIERICRGAGWRLLNPPATLTNTIEEKLSQLEWLSDLTELMPPHTILTGEKLTDEHIGKIAQFNRAHTGAGTIFLTSARIDYLKKTFPHREIKVSTYVRGPVYTNNNIITQSDTVLIGNVSYQITGLAPFTDEPYATIGNDWSLGAALSPKMKMIYGVTVQEIARRLIASGYRGLFGIDMVLSEEDGLFYLIEINARQPASTTYESTLQSMTEPEGLNTLFAHLKTLAGESVDGTLTPIEHGAQIIVRNQPGINRSKLHAIIEDLRGEGLTVIPYENTKPGTELLRIQSSEAIMQTPDTLSPLGRKIAARITTLLGPV